MAPIKEKRQNYRTPLISEIAQWTLFNDDTPIIKEKVNVKDISQGGAFIESIYPIKPKARILIEFPLPGELGSFTVEGQVAWKRWANRKGEQKPLGFGIQFINTPTNIQSILEAYVIYLRNRQIISVSKRIIDDLFDNEPEGPVFL